MHVSGNADKTPSKGKNVIKYIAGRSRIRTCNLSKYQIYLDYIPDTEVWTLEIISGLRNDISRHDTWIGRFSFKLWLSHFEVENLLLR